ncbi:MAG: hypothetical protein IJV93_00490 [Lentisphaeria bacterium]|nr:hypothetical protein [Lentisphaeria bacterium]
MGYQESGEVLMRGEKSTLLPQYRRKFNFQSRILLRQAAILLRTMQSLTAAEPN